MTYAVNLALGALAVLAFAMLVCAIEVAVMLWGRR